MITEILYSLLIFYVMLMFGRKILEKFHVNLDFSEKFIFAVALGFGFFGYIILFFGLLGKLYKNLFLILVIVLAIIFIPEAKRFFKEFKRPKIKFNWMILFIALFLLLNFIGALAPPTGWDTQKYHLSCQEAYIANHQINYVPILHCDLPSLANMFILLGMILKNDITAKLIFYLVFLVLVFAVYVYGKKYFNEECGLLSVLIFLSLPNIIYYASTVHTDMFLSLFTLLAVFSFFYWTKEKDFRWAAILAIFMGFIFATKITGIIMMISFCILFFMKFFAGKNKSKMFIQGILIFLIILIISGVWFVKAFIFTGNPIYPIGYGIFGGIQNLSYGTEYTMMQLNAGGYGKSFIAYILSPIQMTFNGYKFVSSFSLTPLFLLFIPILFFIRKKNLIKYLLLFSFIYYTVLFIFGPFMMKLIPVFSILSILTAYSVLEGFNKKLLSKFMWLFIIFALIFSLAMSGLIYKNQIKVSLGMESRTDYLSRNLDMFDTFNYANSNLKENDKILLVGDERNYYLDVKFQEGDPIRQGLIDYRYINEKELKDWLTEDNITYIILNKNYFKDIKDSELNLYGYTEYSYSLINNFIKEDCNETFEKNNVFLYKII